MNKRGTDKVISVYWFVVLFVVAGGVVYMAAVFYGTPYDVREIEANILINQVADCVATGGKLNYDIGNSLTKDNFLQECHLNFDVEDKYGWKDQGQYYIRLSEGDLSGVSEKFYVGNQNLIINCEEDVGAHSAFCTERGLYVSEGKVIKIFVAVKKVDKNV